MLKMAISNSEIEALAIVKWPMAVWSGKRERYTVRMRKKKKKARILIFDFKITDRYSIGKKLMKQIILLINHYRRICCR